MAGERVRVNGIDGTIISREDKISDKKKVRGRNSQTFSQSGANKVKLQITFEESFAVLDELEKMLANPSFQTSKVYGSSEEKQIISSYNMSRGRGVLNHLKTDGYSMDRYAVKTTSNLLNKDSDWNVVVDEDFSQFVDNQYSQDLTGSTLQDQTLKWYDVSDTGSTSRGSISSNSDIATSGKSVNLQNFEALAISPTGMYPDYDLEVVWKHTGASNGNISIFSGFAGSEVSSLWNSGSYVRFECENNILYYLNSITGQSKSASVSLSLSTWYTTKLVVRGTKTIVYLNGVKLLEVDDPRKVYGDIAIFANYSGLQIDKVTMKALSNPVLSLPESSSTKTSSNLYEGAYGTGHRIRHDNLVEFDHGVDDSSQLHFNFKEGSGTILNDITSNENDGLMTNGSWVDGWFDKGVRLTNGDILVQDDSSISDLSEFYLHTRIKLDNLETSKRSLQANPIISKGSEFTVYDYYVDRGTPDINDGLVIYYPLDGNFLEKSTSQIENIYPGNETVFTNGKFGQCLDLDGSNDDLQVLDADLNGVLDFEDSAGFTVSAYVNVRTTPTNDHHIVSKSTGSTHEWSFYIPSTDPDEFRLRVWDATTGGWIIRTTNGFAFNLNQWYHVLITYDGGASETGISIWVDGVLQTAYNDANSTFTKLRNTTGQFNIGSLAAGGGQFDGLVDDVRVYNRILTSDEIQEIYYGDMWTHYIAFEIYGELLIGDVINRNQWMELWFLCDGKSSYIARRSELSQEVNVEARKVLGELKGYFPLDGDNVNYAVNPTSTSDVVTPTYTTGKLNQGVSLDPADGINIGQVTMLNSMTISAWVKLDVLPAAQPSAYPQIVGKRDSNPRNYFLAFRTIDVVYWEIKEAGGTYYILQSTRTGFQADVWYHIVAQFDLQTGRQALYIDGRLDSEQTIALSAIPDAVADGYIGAGNYQIDGMIDDVRLYDAVLSEEEIQFLYSKGNYVDDLTVNSQGYSSKNRESGLLTHYKLNGNAIDSSIYGNDGTPAVMSYATGKINNAGDFNGSSSTISFDGSSFDMTHGSFSLWFYIKALPSSGDAKVLYHVFNNRIYLQVRSNGYMYLLFGQDSGTKISYPAVPVTQWNHFVLTWKDGYMKFYFNGEEQTMSSDQYTAFVEQLGTVYLGSLNAGSEFFNGYVDDFRWYDYQLPADEISAIYNSGNGTEADSYTTLTMDYLDLRDTMFIPHKAKDSLQQVRIWDLEENSPNNFVMKDLTYEGLFNNGVGKRTDQMSIFKEITHGYNVLTNTTRWSTDVPSKFEESSLYLTNQEDYNTDLNLFELFDGQLHIFEATFSAWVKITEPDVASGNIYLWYDAANEFIIYLTPLTNVFYFKFMVVEDVTTPTLESITMTVTEGSIPVNKWFKIDMTFDHGVVKVYINGVKVGQDTTTSQFFYGENSQDLVYDGYNADYYVSNSKMYNKVLTGDEINLIYKSDPMPPYYKSNIIYSINQDIDKNSALFAENGLFGMLIYKGKEAEGVKQIGGVDFYRWEDGWKPVGKLMAERSD